MATYFQITGASLKTKNGNFDITDMVIVLKTGEGPIGQIQYSVFALQTFNDFLTKESNAVIKNLPTTFCLNGYYTNLLICET